MLASTGGIWDGGKSERADVVKDERDMVEDGVEARISLYERKESLVAPLGLAFGRVLPDIVRGDRDGLDGAVTTLAPVPVVAGASSRSLAPWPSTVGLDPAVL